MSTIVNSVPAAKVETGILAGTRTLLYKEVLRFWKVSFQTVAAPVLTAVLYLLIFGHVLEGRVVALDRTSALLAGTASTMLRFKLDKPLPPALTANSRVTGRIVQITAHDAREVESILAVLHAAGCEPEDLEIGRADLEDVFIEIMRGETPQRVAA